MAVKLQHKILMFFVMVLLPLNYANAWIVPATAGAATGMAIGSTAAQQKSLYEPFQVQDEDFNKAERYLSRIAFTKAEKYYKVAAQKNIPEAYHRLGEIYAYRQGFITKKKRKKLNQQSAEYFRMAAEMGLSASQNVYGWILYEGKYIQENVAKAIHWLEKANQQNYARAAYNIAYIYILGEKVPQDFKRALPYMTKSANLGYLEAQFTMGLIYDAGRWIPRDYKLSYHYFTLAANQGHKKSKKAIKYIHKGKDLSKL